MLSRVTTVTLIVYAASAMVLVAITGSSLLFVSPADRIQFVWNLSPWLPGLLCLPTAVAASAIAYRRRNPGLAVGVAATFFATSAVLYAWANTVAFSGGGAWDQLRAITGGGLYPILIVLGLVSVGAVATLGRATRQRLARSD